jgi:hypothetical protein
MPILYDVRCLDALSGQRAQAFFFLGAKTSRED